MTDENSWRGVRFGLVLGLLAAACGPGKETADETGTTGEDTTGASDPSVPTTGETDATDATDATGATDATDATGATDPTGDSDESTVSLVVNRDVDLLFVIDNSGSMADEQALLAKNIVSLVNVLEAADANYRIGVTTTDSGNPRCPSAIYTPEGGNLVLSSCLDRVDQNEFKFGEDDFSYACSDLCTKRDADLTVWGTSTAYDPNEQPRKWVERTEGQSNIGGVESNVEALQCYLPQGVAGCGFESHLESMYLALAKATDMSSENNYGFLRETAQLAVVFLSDETDCSYNPGTKEIFTTNKVFWNDPDDPAPTSAMCWRAGVECTGAGPVYSECHAQDYGIKGSPVDDPSQAALHPVSKYIDFVKQIEDSKQNLDENLRVKVSLITGVPVGYEDFVAEIPYEDATDPTLQANFGIGPGCVLDSATAVPPVREREFAEAFNVDNQHRNLYSICQPDYSAALAAIAEEIADDVVPTCMPNCVKDLDPTTQLVEPGCAVYEDNIAQGTHDPIPQCMEVNGQWTAPAGATVCYATLTDKDGSLTPSKLDDMAPGCVDEGFNLEFSIVRVAPAPPGTTISAACELSENKQRDCPNL